QHASSLADEERFTVQPLELTYRLRNRGTGHLRLQRRGGKTLIADNEIEHPEFAKLIDELGAFHLLRVPPATGGRQGRARRAVQRLFDLAAFNAVNSRPWRLRTAMVLRYGA